MEEYNITDEEIKEMIKEFLNSSITVEDAINQKKDENELARESFDICDKTYSTVSSARIGSIAALNITKIRLYLYKLIPFLLTDGATSIIDDSISKINATKEKLVNEKELLNNIRNSIKELKKYNVYICNYDINILLAALYKYNDTVMLDLQDYMQWCTMAINGITYYGNKDYDKEMEELNDVINNYTLRLGLNK